MGLNTLSVFKTTRLLKPASPIVLLRYDFIPRRPLNDRSAEHDVAGIVLYILATDTNTGSHSDGVDDLITPRTSATVVPLHGVDKQSI